MASWRAFPDTVPALKRLGQKYRLAVLSNVDDDLFAGTAAHLEIPFHQILTARQMEAYKPSPAFFEAALQRIGLPSERILHVAQSLHHDIRPAKRLGLASVWINRRHARPGFGATPPAEGRPDLVLPDLKSLADLLVPV
jgi:2-haloacid dehalogenase